MTTLFGDSFVDVMKSFYENVRSRVKIRVEGYDSSLPRIDICKALRNHFKSCGEVFDVEIPRDRVTDAFKSWSFVVLRGESAAEKALALNGSDMGGSKIAIEVLPQAFGEGSVDEVAARRVAHFRRSHSDGVSITGYDPLLPEDDVKSFLRKHFSSCGFITDVFLLNNKALIYFYGLGAVQSAVKLCGSKVGEWQLVANALPIGPIPKHKPKEDNCPNFPPFGSAPFGSAPFGSAPFGSAPFGSASPDVVDMMDFEYTVPALGINEIAYG